MNRRQFISSALVAGLVTRVQAQTLPATQPSTQSTSKPAVPDDLVWHDLRDWPMWGRGFADTELYFDRLPARAKGVVRDEVWNLSRNTAGFQSHFMTDAPALYIRYELSGQMLSMPHMPATGVSGVDLYAKEENGWTWLSGTRPRSTSVEGVLTDDVAPGLRAYHLNLPLYNGVSSMQIGVPKRAAFGPIGRNERKPILFYGTSITQGGCASRPGLAFTNVLSRRLDREILNFGFSGNGRMELEVARFLVELDPSIFVVDCLANISAQLVRERTEPLVRLIRQAHPNTPILLLDERTWSNTKLAASLRTQQEEKRAALQREFAKLKDAGVGNLHYRYGGDLLGQDTEGTVDGSHPNDLGMMRYADALEPTLKSLIE